MQNGNKQQKIRIIFRIFLFSLQYPNKTTTGGRHDQYGIITRQ
ncbi:Hypothetical protein LOCK908_1394 [Lacticaseibacillus rhamnosus LOCK908]|uniref:Uncharacterized protein n=1 Tax=Lacticaseibacillus rhamnosus (strain LMS2-1) TaxID=525361 RepID=C2JWV5_LACRM|nr:conserved hypothetical protein [Lacticaseibacillus rhamnosus ATCC 8530]AGP74033.1 Hypothetical protein LOCK908_1394 [Lacticaseibacillus rhamnosus LOCK908]EEN80539.1 hypothetical protein HMPREF0539_1389 [Lacticaseibacillus rhamnosus LMS2-1]